MKHNRRDIVSAAFILNNAEGDFIVQKDRVILPIEVNSSSGGTLRSLLQRLIENRLERP